MIFLQRNILHFFPCILLACLALLYSCTWCNNSDPSPEFKPTPYTLETPLQFGTNFKIPDTNLLTKEGIALGRMLFYEKRLSSNNKVSCGSCHQQKFAFADNTPLSFGAHGKKGKRNAMALSNLLWQRTFFWDGRAHSLEEQALIPIQDTLEMSLTLAEACQKLQSISEYPPLFKKAFGSEGITPARIAKAISQFERTLISGGSKFDRFLREGRGVLTDQEHRGFMLFMTHPEPRQNLRGGNCGDCHGGNLIQSLDFENNGLESVFKDLGRGIVTRNSFDNGKFKVPSLRNVALTAPYMHDGRFKTLEEVLDHYNEHVQYSHTLSPLILEASNNPGGGPILGLTKKEKQDIIAFMHTLTDSSFITNHQFSNPFEK